MRMLLPAYGSRGDTGLVAGPTVRLWALATGVRVCAGPDQEFAERLAGAGVPLAPAGARR